MTKKLIQKYQQPSLPLLPGLEGFIYKGPVYQKLQGTIDPKVRDKISINNAILNNPTREIVTYKDSNGNIKTTTNIQAGVLSPADPIGEFIVVNAVMGKPLEVTGKAIGKVWNYARNPYGLGFTPFIRKKDYMRFVRDQYNTAYNTTRPNLLRVVNYYGSKYKAKTGDKSIAIIDPERTPSSFSLFFTDLRNRKLPIDRLGQHSWATSRKRGNRLIPIANEVSLVHHDIPLVGKYFLMTPENIQNTVAHEWAHGVQDVYENWFKGLGYYDKTLKTPIKITDGFKFDRRGWSADPEELGAEYLGLLGSKYGGKTYYELTPEELLEFTNHLGNTFLLGLKNTNKAALFHPSEFKAAKENAKLLPERFETWSNNTKTIQD